MIAVRLPANGNDPSPVRQRLKKTPSPNTLSPRERAVHLISPLAPAEFVGTHQSQNLTHPMIAAIEKTRLQRPLLR